MAQILGFAGVLFVICGCSAAAAADLFPAHRVQLRDWGAQLFVAGAALAGFSLPMI